MLINLTDEELLFLDGICRPVTQTEVDKAFQRATIMEDLQTDLPLEYKRLIAEAVRLARQTLHFSYRVSWSSGTCHLCKFSPGYHIRTRATKYAAKGSVDFSKPNQAAFCPIGGERICKDCLEKIKPVLADVLLNEQIEIPKYVFGQEQKWKLVNGMACTKCDWRGYQHDMYFTDPIISSGSSDGRYPSGCPICKARNGLFRDEIKSDLNDTKIIPFSNWKEAQKRFIY